MLNLDPSATSDIVATSRALRIIARDAALKVAPALLAAFRSRMAIDYKVDLHDPVTEFDRQSEATIRAHIMAAEPDSVIVGEEGGTAGGGTITWYVDPIDGTSNFACGLAFWCVSIGAVIGDEMVAGVVYDPVADDMFSADLTGAWLGDEPLRSVGQAEEARASLITGQPKPLGMAQGLDSTFDAAIYIGYHAPGSTGDAVHGHTFSGALKTVATL